MLSGLAARNAEAMLRVLDGIVDEGHDLIQLWSELISALRDLLLIRAVEDADDLLARSPEEARRLADAAEGLGAEDVNRAFQVLADLEPALRSTARPRFLFESALVRWAGLGAMRPIEEILATMGDAAPARPGPAAQKKNEPTAVKRKPRAVAVPDRNEDLRPALSSALEGKPMLASIVDQARSARVDGDRLVLEYDEGARSMLGPLEREGGLAALREAADRLVGRALTPRVVVGSKEPKKAAGPPDAGPPDTPRPAVGSGQRNVLLREATQEPGVKKLLREFGAQVVEIKPIDHVPDPDTSS
jgi:hypothetical protein